MLPCVVEDPRARVRAAVEIERRIAVGELARGQRLNVGLLAEEIGVYRAAVSRALAVLEGRGLVQRFPGLGWFVS